MIHLTETPDRHPGEFQDGSLRRAFAFHEAGHVAAALVLGYRVTAAWLHASGGRTLFTTPHSDRDAALIALAGTIAQWRVAPRSPLTASDDLDGVNMRCWADAEALVEQHWDLVERVAAELIEHGELELCGAVAARIGLVLSK